MSDMNDDDFFKNMAKKADEHKTDPKGYQPPAEGSGSGEFTQVDYTALETGNVKILRALGTRPDLDVSQPFHFKQSPHDARIVNVSKIADDNGKNRKMILPPHTRQPDHVIWKMIDKINEVEWVENTEKGKKPDGKPFMKTVPKNKYNPEYTEIWKEINEPIVKNKLGLEAKGWVGNQFIFINVIDRDKIDWHRQAKRTFLLAKNEFRKTNEDGSEYVNIDEGIPYLGIRDNLLAIAKKYGNWENHDLIIGRTGTTSNPYPISNADKNPEDIEQEARRALIKSGPLTAEERSWEPWDLTKFNAVSPYGKWKKYFSKKIKNIDAIFRTNFYSELEALAEKEAQAYKEAKDLEKAVEESKPEFKIEASGSVAPAPQAQTTTPAKEEAIAHARRVVEAPAPAPDSVTAKLSDLKGWAKLSDTEKKLVVGVTEDLKPIYADSVGAGEPCPRCNEDVPLEFNGCPSCGTRWATAN